MHGLRDITAPNSFATIKQSPRVFSQRVGGVFLDTEEMMEGKTGWREVTAGGARVEVTYYEAFGWMTDDERFDLRQSEPRIAP